MTSLLLQSSLQSIDVTRWQDGVTCSWKKKERVVESLIAPRALVKWRRVNKTSALCIAMARCDAVCGEEKGEGSHRRAKHRLRVRVLYFTNLTDRQGVPIGSNVFHSVTGFNHQGVDSREECWVHMQRGAGCLDHGCACCVYGMTFLLHQVQQKKKAQTP